MSTAINEVQLREIPQGEQTKSKNVSYKANPNNTLERIPDADTYSSDKKKKRTIGIVAGTLATVALVLGAVCFKKGAPAEGADKKFIDRMKDGWKELWGKGKKVAEEAKDDATEAEAKAKAEAKATAKKVETEAKAKPEPEPKANSIKEEPASDGLYGQDIYDPTDPLNEMDPLSPYYKNPADKGIFGQDIYDPIDPFNEMDPLSPYYINDFGYNEFGY